MFSRPTSVRAAFVALAAAALGASAAMTAAVGHYTSPTFGSSRLWTRTKASGNRSAKRRYLKARRHGARRGCK